MATWGVRRSRYAGSTEVHGRQTGDCPRAELVANVAPGAADAHGDSACIHVR
jgi:hypothetical protein